MSFIAPADGIAGLYRGFVISCVGIVVYRGLYFGLYDSLKPALGSYSDNFLATFVLGWGITNLAGEDDDMMDDMTTYDGCTPHVRKVPDMLKSNPGDPLNVSTLPLPQALLPTPLTPFVAA